MQNIAIMLVASLPCLACFGGATAILLTGGTEGWGWLLVLGLCALPAVKIKRDAKE